MKIANIIVGAGIAGAVLARRIAEEKGEKVLVVEKRDHIGGYCYDYRDEQGIFIHKFGPHIFRTDNVHVWNYVNRFSEFKEYQHKVLAYVQGHFYPMPINIDTVNGILGTSFNSDQVLEYFDQVRNKNISAANVKDVVESQVGNLFYELFFKNYTKKQWGEDPSLLPKEIISRIPIRSNREDRYFTVKYQGMPEQGYTQMIRNILSHKNIKVLLNTDYREISTLRGNAKLFYSGPIDEYYEYCFGKLPYRCVSFKLEKYDQEYYQPVAVVNYPNDYDYTRITEYKHFYGNRTSCTVIGKEFSSNEGEPSYPIPQKENKALYEKYFKLAEKDAINFIGRLGEYQYYSMDQIIEKMLHKEI